jgi:hypothetical protein
MEDTQKVSKSVILAMIGGVFVILAILLNFILETPQKNIPNKTASQKKAEPETKSKVAVLKKEEPEINQIKIPSFDIVRVTPEGDTVMAGRAIPGAKVEIYDLGKKIGEVFADRRGEWVFVPMTPLTAGSRKLSLQMTSPDQFITKSTSDLIIVVPEKGKNIAGLKTDQPSQPLAIKIPKKPGGRLQVLQKPNIEEPISIAIDTVDYDDSGKLDIGGKAPADAIINLYLNEEFLGRSNSNERGLWHQTPKRKIKHGKYTIRADHVDKNGHVKSRVEVVFARSIPLSGIKPGTLIVVESGRSLWRIARKAYGAGLRYTVIYEANKDQIKDPDIIFPGQVFSLPPAK